MGGAQPLAVTLNDGVAICVEVDASRIERRIAHRYLDVQCRLGRRRAAAGRRGTRRRGRPLSIGLLGNAAEVVPDLLARGAAIDIVTDQTARTTRWPTCRSGVAFDDWDARDEGPCRLHQPGPRVDGPALRGDGRLRRTRAPRCSTTATRCGPRPARRLRPGLRLSRASCRPTSGPLFCEGKGPFRWAALSGDPADIAATDRAVLDLFPDDEPLPRWITRGPGTRRLPGPAGADLLAGVRRAAPGGLRFNDMVAQRRAQGARWSSAATTSTAGRSRRPTARPSPCWTAPTQSPTGRCSTRWSTSRQRRELGVDPPRRRRRHRAARSTPDRWSCVDGTAAGGREGRAGAHQRPRHGCDPARRRGLRRGREVATARDVRVPMREADGIGGRALPRPTTSVTA